ncbi:hypothetical protein PG994_000623 [Apiospora phragmitis]|uniref:Oxidase ustYa n=1 Tax=Apiospora phragmitis TaxID=2905665 RepID=A0ABR1X6R9_9PEZI
MSLDKTFTVTAIVLTIVLCVATFFLIPWNAEGVLGYGVLAVQTLPDAGPAHTIPKIFRPMTYPNSTMNDFWKSVEEIPNGGMVSVQTADGPARKWGVSMWHQLHCLSLFRALLSGETHHHHGSSRRPEDHENFMFQEFGSVHWVHCLDYLAEGILCAADETLEPPKTVTMPSGETIDFVDGLGSGSVHKCRPARHLWDASTGSAKEPWESWEHQPGDTVTSVLSQADWSCV